MRQKIVGKAITCAVQVKGNWRQVNAARRAALLGLGDKSIAPHGARRLGHIPDDPPVGPEIRPQSRRDKKAAKRLFRKLLKKQGRAPRVLITGKLRSCAAAKREIMPGVEHRPHKGLNNRAENSHQPTRRREQIMKRFRSPRQVQRFLSTHDQIANVFSRRPSQDTAAKFHSARSQAFTIWAEVTGVAIVA
jgi:putative transposase